MASKLFIRKKIVDFDIFFCFLTNKVFIKKQHVWLKHTIVNNAFFVLNGLLNNSKIKIPYILKFFSQYKKFWSFFWSFTCIDKHNSVGFFVDLELIGLGYRIRKITSRLYRFFWGYANYVYLFAPKEVLVEYLPEERLVFFFGVDANSVNSLTTYLMLLKKLSSYRVTGFVRPGKIIRLNSGKQR